jgi:hypothetical protein
MGLPQVCTVCNEPILDRGCSTDLLTTVQRSPLCGYNYLSFHMDHWNHWRELDKFKEALEAAAQHDLWEGESTVPILG